MAAVLVPTRAQKATGVLRRSRTFGEYMSSAGTHVGNDKGLSDSEMAGGAGGGGFGGRHPVLVLLLDRI